MTHSRARSTAYSRYKALQVHPCSMKHLLHEPPRCNFLDRRRRRFWIFWGHTWDLRDLLFFANEEMYGKLHMLRVFSLIHLSRASDSSFTTILGDRASWLHYCRSTLPFNRSSSEGLLKDDEESSFHGFGATIGAMFCNPTPDVSLLAGALCNLLYEIILMWI